MSRIDVNEDEYIAICNDELKRHERYEEGMEVVNVPEGASGSEASGYSWKGPESTRGVVADVAGIVDKKYRLRVTPRK